MTVLPPGEWDPSIRIEPPSNGCAKLSRRATVDSHPHKSHEVPVEPTHSGASDTGESMDGGDGSNSDKKKNIVLNGLVGDFHIWKHRLRDLKDGINLQCFGTVFFIYFLLLAVVMTVGEHESKMTKGLMVSSTIYKYA